MSHTDLLDQALSAARHFGATAAEALVAESQETSVTWRLGKVEELERSSAKRLGLRVLIGQSQAIASGSDLTPAMLQLAEDNQVRAVAVITDGDIAFPAETMPYDVLWVLPPSASPGFRPPYGRVVMMQQS